MNDMKQVFLLIIAIVAIFMMACHETTIGYLVTENASYVPDTLIVRKNPDPKLDATRIEFNSPWVCLPMQGYQGTEEIYFFIESVTSDQGEDAAQHFLKDLTIRGGGVLMYPLKNDAKPGRYIVSVRLTNPGYSQVVKDAFTFIVKE